MYRTAEIESIHMYTVISNTGNEFKWLIKEGVGAFYSSQKYAPIMWN